MQVLGGKMTTGIIPTKGQTVCVDFDGVLNNYKGYDGDNLGTPRPGAREFLEQLSKEYDVVVFSVRRYSKIIKWLTDYDLLKYVVNVTSYKPLAVAYIDDRAIRFNGNYNETLEELKDFKPYWKG